MKAGLNGTREALSGIFIQAFTAPTDRPFRDGQGRVRGEIWAALGVLSLSVLFWFLMNIPFQPRFFPAPFVRTPLSFASLGANLCFSLILRFLPKGRSLACIPLIFSIFPLAFLLLSLPGAALRTLFPAERGLEWKFLYDGIFFTAELLCIFLLMIPLKPGNPFSLKKLKGQPMEGFVRCWELLFFAAFLFLLGILLSRTGGRFPLPRLFSLLKYQISFALLLGLKEELIFRWVLLRKGEELLGSRILAVCVTALIWGLYHGFFGEGIGRGLLTVPIVCVVSFWWSLLSYRYDSVLPAWAGHTAVELYGFYLLYLPFME